MSKMNRIYKRVLGALLTKMAVFVSRTTKWNRERSLPKRPNLYAGLQFHFETPGGADPGKVRHIVAGLTGHGLPAYIGRMQFTANVQVLECFVRMSELIDGGSPELAARCWADQIVSRVDDRLRFNLVTEDGARRDDVPLDALVMRAEPSTAMEWHVDLFQVPAGRYSDSPQLWGCPDPGVSVEYRPLMMGRCVAVKIGGTVEHCDYLCTANWHSVGVRNTYGDVGHKCAHVLATRSTGELLAQPNNRICLLDPATGATPWISMTEPPRYRLRREGPLETACERQPRLTPGGYLYAVEPVE